VRPGGDPADWYRAVTLYHFLAEGMLAMTVLHSLAQTVRALPGLDALSRGLSRVTRDEARHAAFGVIAIRDGVDRGYRDAVESIVMSGVPAVARALVDPERPVAVPALPPLAARRGRLLTMQWDLADRMLTKRLAHVGLADLAGPASAAWNEGCAAAVGEYEDLHGRRHPSRLAHLVPSEPVPS
jgi:ribonucleoside-diphosphate reductase beta chain